MTWSAYKIFRRKRDVTNRNWQRIILRNAAKSLGFDMGDSASCNVTSVKEPASIVDDTCVVGASEPHVVETRQLWWQIHSKMQESDYGNMLLLAKMEDALETLLYNRKQKYITKSTYEKMVNKIHLDTEGSVVEPFVELAERQDREERQRIWYESLALDMEEECLIK